MRHMCHRMGIQRISQPVFNEIRFFLFSWIGDVLLKLKEIMSYDDHKKTVTWEDVMKVLSPKIILRRRKVPRCRPNTPVLPNCFVFPVQSFLRVLRLHTMDLEQNLRFTPEAITLLQFALETYFAEKVKMAYENMTRARRKTLFSEDFSTH